MHCMSSMMYGLVGAVCTRSVPPPAVSCARDLFRCEEGAGYRTLSDEGVGGPEPSRQPKRAVLAMPGV